MTSQRKLRKPILLITLAAGVLLFSATFYAQDTVPFPHSLHLDEGVACKDCHDASGTGTPVLNTEACLDCHEDGPPAFHLENKGRKITKIDFPHPLHTEVGECIGCHKGTIEGTLPADSLRVAVKDCRACHVENGLAEAGDCTPCHTADMGKTPPPSHDADWRKGHNAKMQEGGFTEHGTECSTCHGDNACMNCHQRKKPMSHKAHLEERDAECDSCHVVDASRQLPLLDAGACLDCHEGEVQTTLLRSPRARKLNIEFPHATHTGAVECARCHLATLNDEQPEGEPIVEQTDCISCHTDEGVEVAESSCAKCHGTDKKSEKPSSHEQSWFQRHGIEAEMAAVSGHGQDCNLCHTDNACAECHANTGPADHNGLWRVRLHGESATWDPDRCATCHEQGACINCHQNNKPISHSGAWPMTHGLAAGSRDNEECTVCHSEAQCVRCHSGQ